jgi:hypothetical protein
MGDNGRQWVGERFGFPEYISGLEDLFRRVITPASPAILPGATRACAHAA